MDKEKVYNSFYICAFRAIDDAELCKEYIEGHVKVLTDYGITNVTSNNNLWINNPNMFCVVLMDAKTKELLGGIRVQVSDEIFSLPVEIAISKMDDRIHSIVKSYRLDGGVGELCGLWNSKKIAGYGTSMILIRAGISITDQLNIKTLIGICAQYSLKMFQNVGFVVDKDLGNMGDFPYPNEKYTANVVGILNSNTLCTSNPLDKSRIVSIRNEPCQSFTETGPKGNVNINYNLIIKRS